MEKNNKRILIFIGILVILGAIIVGTFYLLDKKNSSQDDPNQIQLLDKIEGYDYNLEDRDTKLFKDTFMSLKGVLESKEIDYELYAEYLSELYIIDLYTIDNKLNKYDVGGSEYVLEGKKENFELKVKDTIYKYVEDNSNSKRTQELPVVASVEVEDKKEVTYKLDDESYSGYEVKLKFTYEKDLGYDKDAVITLIKVENKLYVVEQK